MNESSPSRDGVAFGCVLKAWQSHEAELLGFLRHQVGDPHRADDLLQEVFVKAMRQGQGFCDLLQPRAWLFQVARNALIDEARRQRPTVALDEDLPASLSDEPSPVDELAGCVERNLPRLEAGDHDILRRCDLEGWRVHEYADREGLTLAAAKARLRRARMRLRQLLVERCGVRFDQQGDVCCALTPPPPPR
jgi:RNA polymerase sigma-70 factor (ECF subfamily)